MIAVFKRLLEQWNVRQKALELQQKLIDADIETLPKLARRVTVGTNLGDVGGACVFFKCRYDKHTAWDFIAHVPDVEEHEICLYRHRPNMGPVGDPNAYTDDGEPSFQTVDQAVEYIRDHLANS